MGELPERQPPGVSLRVRMLVSATLVLVLVLGIMGLVLDNAFRLSAEEAVAERLLLHVYAMITASEEDEAEDASSLFLPEDLQEPLFNQLESGLYGFVYNDAGVEIWRSRSALGIFLDEMSALRAIRESTPGLVDFYRYETGNLAGHFALTYRIVWQTGTGEAQYSYVVIQDEAPFRREVRAFRNSLWTWLAAGVVLLISVQAIIMSWGLQPIGTLERDLKAIETGERDYLAGTYPKEIAGVTHNLNLLLNQERAQQERYRNTLADLAHSLKTPLAIVSAEAAKPDEPDRAVLEDQVQRMNDIVSYQLERAVVQASSILMQSIPVKPVVEKLIAAMERVYQSRDLRIVLTCDDATFAGDERDLMELLGNLVDNACKYGGQLVRVSIVLEGDECSICVEDDGSGISESDREAVLERGLRLDSRESGQGIGLAVVAELVDRHHGTIVISESSLGGAAVTVRVAA